MNRRSAELPIESSPPTKIQKQIHIHPETHFENDVSPSSSHSVSDDVLIPKLPIEVITHIFRFLPLRERLNASLVCTEWHEAGSVPCYSRTEKLVIYGFQDLEKLLLFLLETKRKILNLEFCNCDPSSLNLALIADKIHCLGFINCKLSFTLLIGLFVKCVNLNEFYFKQNERLDSCFNCEMTKPLEQPEEKHFVNENLQIFRVKSYYRPGWTTYNLQSIFRMFPNIKHFVYNDSYLPNISIREIISLKYTLENLRLLSSKADLSLLMLQDFTRLKKISLYLWPDMSETVIFDFFSRLKCLERISCSSIRGSSFTTRFFQHLIHQCPRLKHLKLMFRVSCHIDLSPEMFRTLVSSKLISLKIVNPNIRPTSDQLFTTAMESLVNKTLRVLQIPRIIDHRLQSLFIKSFKNLKILRLECLSGTVLESIGQYQKNLMILNLSLLCRLPSHRSECSISPAPEWRLRQVIDCLQSLTCLENLELDFDGHAHSFDCQFVPLSVKYLTIRHSGYCMFNNNSPRQLILALKEKAELEAICFECNDCVNDFSTWSEICSSLNKLRLLSLRVSTRPNEMGPLPEPDPEKTLILCERCPSLRFFFNKIRFFGYDYTDRKMKAIDDALRINFVPTIDKIANSKVTFYMMY